MAKVFITQEQSKLNYLPAERFGEVKFITRDEFSPVAASLGNTHLMGQIRDSIMEFNPSTDFIVFSGSPTVAAAVFACLGKFGHSAFRVLRWSNRDSVYTPITITL